MAPKRNAAIQAGKPKKVCGVDPTLDKCRAVVTALNDLTVDLPPVVRNMLAAMAPKCLSTLAVERVGAQNQVVKMIDEVLKAVDERLAGLVAAKQAPVGEAESEKAVLQGHLLETEQELDRLQQVTKVAKDAVGNSGVELQRAEGTLNDLRTDKVLVRAESACRDLECFYKDTFLPLHDRAADEQALKALLELGKKYTFDATLLSSMPTAFGKEPDSRGCFDKMILEQYDASVMKCIEAAQVQVEEEKVKQNDRAIQISTTEVARDAAFANVEASKIAYVNATVAEGSRVVAVANCKSALDEFLANLQPKINELEKVTIEYDSFREKVIKSLEYLKELAPVPKATAEVPAVPAVVVLESVTVDAAT